MSHLQPRFVVSERSYSAAPSQDRHPFYQAVLPQRGRLEMRIAQVRGCAGETSFALVPIRVEHIYWACGPPCEHDPTSIRANRPRHDGGGRDTLGTYRLLAFREMRNDTPGDSRRDL
jgi:hypothetical protein